MMNLHRPRCAISTRHNAPFKPTRLHMALLVALSQTVWIPGIHAQMMADSAAPLSQQPTVLETANGVPLVNIQIPSAAGVSRNNYQQFDIHASGAILNNAQNNTQTQLGGWVQGNPRLSQGAARVILNEVNSSNPSQLHGPLEIAGQRAELVIANPAGISCYGCGFINAQRTMLTTGTPLFHGDQLEGYRVHGGVISISGAGMDARSTDYTALIARSVAVNADLWAQQLQVITGSQEISADHTTFQPIAAASNAPTFSLDVSALGGMYAQKIVLHGTEHGVGVRNAGTIGAQAGELIVTSAGRLENSGILNGQTTAKLSTNNVLNTGLIRADQNLIVQATNTVDNQHGQLLGAENLHLNAHNLNNGHGILYAKNNLIATVDDTLDNKQGLIVSDKSIELSADKIINSHTKNNPLLGIQGKTIQLTVEQIDNSHGMLAADQHINLQGVQLNNHHGQMISADKIAISVQQVHNADGTLLAEHLLQIAADTLDGNGQLLSKGAIDLNLQKNFINTGEITANARAELRISGRLDNHSKLQVGDLYVQANRINNTDTGIIHGNHNTVIADTVLENHGIIDGGIAYIQSNLLNNSGTGRIYGDELSISAHILHNREENNQAAVITARQRLAMGVNTLFNYDQALVFSAGSNDQALMIGGALNAHHQVIGQATSVHNNSATIESLGGLTIHSQSLLNTNAHFATQVVQVADPQRYLYIQPIGQPIKYHVNEFSWEKWSEAGRYRHKQTGQEVKSWTQFDVMQTEYETQVISSAPALIRASGNINLFGNKLINDKSQIIAGGVLQGDLDHLENIDGLGEYTIHQVGSSQYTNSNWRGGVKRHHERKWGKKIAYTPVDEVNTIHLGVVKTKQNTQVDGSGFIIENRSIK